MVLKLHSFIHLHQPIDQGLQMILEDLLHTITLFVHAQLTHS